MKDFYIPASEIPGTVEIKDLTAAPEDPVASNNLVASKDLDIPVKKSSSPSKAGSSKKHFLAWDKEYSHLKWGGPASIRSLQAYLAPGMKVLDAGSGNGRYLGELSRRYSAVGVDISLIALRSSRTQLARSGRFAEHFGASVHALPFKSGSFDGILCYGVLQHLFKEEREAAVREFMHVLNCGGLIFFEAFGREDMRCGGEPSSPFENNTFVRQNGIIYHYFTEEEVKELFCGFEVLELESVRKEKTFGGESYVRHMVRGVFRKLRT
ncbi:TPA: class I SAM-dependent methyltransferase [Methanosarcina acetivorans]|uniref:LysM protein n=2 Tax=Methanosarcina acetivorans TaxID=2214 RepID=Q8TTA2_METAC|nr:class I SAM-dependent methyltransferase [Methanosarcina acetivorans]AAM03979.1 LysM protein [Methanosarcina acetivorans C2A]HIH93586.1 class I SAM-dependent methyltransferase [Methanosarcina acetivorans]